MSWTVDFHDEFASEYDELDERVQDELLAVIEAIDGFSYWALRHPADKPDFHNTEGFALLLDPPLTE